MNKSLDSINTDVDIRSLILDNVSDFGIFDYISNRESIERYLSRGGLGNIEI
jgi:hypothetical protein